MHLRMILIALAVAYSLRLATPWVQTYVNPRSPVQRWYLALGQFVLPPLFLLTTGISVACMGVQGFMWGTSVGWLGYWVALGFLTTSIVILLGLLRQSWMTLDLIGTYPQIEVLGRSGRLLDSPGLFAAQVGFWSPKLVLSQGLLEQLDVQQLEAVLYHEQAHGHYRDTFWFFGLGWLRQISGWLPHSEFLWQELLLLRECRADSWAAQTVDPLVLAETLLWVVRESKGSATPDSCVAFGDEASIDRLEERIEALIELDMEGNVQSSGFSSWGWMFVAVLPLLTMPFHY
jgi:Zn-dependent protease with chaperone function